MLSYINQKKTHGSMDRKDLLRPKVMEKLGRKRIFNLNLKNQKRKKNINLGHYFSKCDRSRINSLNL